MFGMTMVRPQAEIGNEKPDLDKEIILDLLRELRFTPLKEFLSQKENSNRSFIKTSGLVNTNDLLTKYHPSDRDGESQISEEEKKARRSAILRGVLIENKGDKKALTQIENGWMITDPTRLNTFGEITPETLSDYWVCSI